MNEATLAELEARSRAFVKIAALAAVHIKAVNTAVEAGNMDLLKDGLEFGQKVSEGILSQIPQEVLMEVAIDMLASEF
ncbi:hypothetical protein SEA_PHREDRICK_204 [Streptomyces phage Phredrick]|jgi:hypothetical protein|nr:hypothetical protein SEA_PHREDRICK_204 [Streptomyces phage Phredrick]